MTASIDSAGAMGKIERNMSTEPSKKMVQRKQTIDPYKDYLDNRGSNHGSGSKSLFKARKDSDTKSKYSTLDRESTSKLL